MNTYQVLQSFIWGQLSLEKGQRLLVDDLGRNEGGTEQSRVAIDGGPDQYQNVTTPAVQSMVALKKIEKN